MIWPLNQWFGNGTKEKIKPAPAETPRVSAAEKCAQATQDLNRAQAEAATRREKSARAWLIRSTRIEKIYLFIKDRPDQCFNGELLAELLPAADEEEREFFRNFGRDKLYWGGVGVYRYYNFRFFQNEQQEWFFTYNPTSYG